MKPIRMNPTKIAAGVIAAVMVAAMTACGAVGSQAHPSPTPTVNRPVSIAAPPSADLANVQVKVTGNAGDTVDVYAFSGGWSVKTPPDCTSTDNPTRSVTLGVTGEDTVQVSLGHPGLWWWVVASTKENVVSKCGGVSTIATYQPSFFFAGPTNSVDGLNTYQATLPVGKPITYYVKADAAAPDSEQGWPVTVKWLGPFDSGPAARTGCASPSSPVGATSTGRALASKPGGGGGGKFSVTLPKPGAYAIVATTPATKWSPTVTTACDDQTPYLIAK